jgi:hypothetical protein
VWLGITTMIIKVDVAIISHNKNSKRLKSAIYWKSTITDNIICTIQFQPTSMNIHAHPALNKKMVTTPTEIVDKRKEYYTRYST